MRPFRINFYSGIFFRRDAISNSLLHKYEVVQSLRAKGVPVDCRIFTHASDHELPETIIVPSAAQAVTHPAFHDADLHIYEFGIYYDLFNAILLGTRARKFVFYHNITPSSLVPDGPARRAVERSQMQLHNLWEANKIVCISEFSRRELLLRGFKSDDVSVIHLPPSLPVAGEPKSLSDEKDVVRLLFVGRFTLAKGVLDLIRAIGILKREGLTQLKLDLVGAMRFSDAAFLAELRALVEREDVSSLVNLVGELPEQELANAYREADIFVMPSYHEGYCVPLIEAMSFGCFPVVSDAGNLPYLLSGLGLLSPVGDVQALAQRLGETVAKFLSARRTGIFPVLSTERGVMTASAWQDAVAEYIEHYSQKAYSRAISDLLQNEINATQRRGHDAAYAAV